MDIDKIIESVHPKNNRERNKLRKALSQVHVCDCGGHRLVTVPCYLMGVIHDGDWYCLNTLRNSVIVEMYEKRFKHEGACVRDIYGRYWYYMYYYDTVYDDIHFVYIGVGSPDEAAALYRQMGVDTQNYFHLGYDHWMYPHFRFNVSDYMHYGTDDLSTTIEEYIDLLIENNDLLL